MHTTVKCLRQCFTTAVFLCFNVFFPYKTTAPPKAACHPNPCLNGGMCKETGVNQDFDCICPNPRFKGRFCDGTLCQQVVPICLE